MATYKDTWTDASKSGLPSPTREELDELRVGDTVKISNGFERFFVLVRDIKTNTVTGIIQNHLVGTYGYDYRDQIEFEKSHIYSIHIREEPDEAKRAAMKNQRRMMRLLGVQPGEQSAEAEAMLSILRGTSVSDKK